MSSHVNDKANNDTGGREEGREGRWEIWRGEARAIPDLTAEDSTKSIDLKHKTKLTNALPISLLFLLLTFLGWMFEKKLETSYSDTIAIVLSPENKRLNEEEKNEQTALVGEHIQQASEILFGALTKEKSNVAQVLNSNILSVLNLNSSPSPILKPSEILLVKAITAKMLRSKKHYLESLAVIASLTESQQESLGLLFSKSSLLARLGDRAAAIASYEYLLSIQPNNQSANINLALLYLEEGLLVKAEELFLKGSLSTAARKKAKNLAGLGEAYYQQKKYHQAISSLQKSIQYRPGYAFTWRNLARAAKAADEHLLALNSYQKALALNKNSLKVRLEYADYLISRMNYKQAIVQLKQAKNIDRDSFSTRIKLAFSYLQALKPINARKQLNFAKKSIQRESQARQSEAMQKYLGEQYLPAIKLLKSNLKAKRNNDFEYYFVAKSYVAIKRLKDARKYIGKLSSGSAYFYQGKYLLAEAFVDNGQAVQSAEIYREITAHINDNPRILYQAAKAEQAAKNYQLAIDLIAAAIKIAPNRRLLLRRADLYWQLGKVDQALGSLSQLLEQYPRYQRAIYHLANYNQQLGNSNEAISLFSQLTEQNISYGDAQYQLAAIFFEKRQWLRSRRLLAAYLLKKTDSKRARLLYARTFCEADQASICREQLKLVLKLAPDYQPALELAKSLE